jgi:hypothetical protein
MAAVLASLTLRVLSGQAERATVHLANQIYWRTQKSLSLIECAASPRQMQGG